VRLDHITDTNGQHAWSWRRYRAGAGEVAGGGRGAGRRGKVARTDLRRVDEELVELVVVHLETDDGRHGISAIFTHHQRSTSRHHRPSPLELSATYSNTNSGRNFQ